MENEAAVLRYFAQEIEELIKKEKDEIFNEVDGILYKAVQEYENKAKKDAKYRYERSVSEKSKDFAKQKAILNAQKNAEISAYRDTLTQKVFTEVEKKLSLYVQSDAYVESIKNKFISLQKETDLKEGCIYVCKKDVENTSFMKMVEKMQICVLASDRINLGGFIFENQNQGFMIDASYDSLLEEGKEWFYQNSGFHI